VPDRIEDSIFLVAAGYALGTPTSITLGWLASLLAACAAYVRVLGGSLGYFVPGLARVYHTHPHPPGRPPCTILGLFHSNKTVEGFFGGVLSASLLGGALCWITPFNFWQATVLALLICLMGFFGGLVMSGIKRDRNIKDFGNLIEGHGGILDRIDSICFSAPLFFHLVRYYFAV
tara:strand:+ start:3118 stop:3642 length:525 start_codon:yes stop_codon:yes gene_type:complete